MPRRTACSAALVFTLLVGIAAGQSVRPVHAADPPAPPTTVDTWAFCGVNPDVPAAATAVRAMAQAGGIDATFGPCNIPNAGYTPVNPKNRYVSPEVYMRLVLLNATVGMKTVVYDARLYDNDATDRTAAINFWTPVLSNIAAWDLGDEYSPDPSQWNVLVARWARVRQFVEPVTGVAPYTNFLPFANVLDMALADLPGVERLFSFDKYDGDKGVALAHEFGPQVTKLMCAVNVFDFTFVATPTTVRNDMNTLVSAGCDHILVFGGFRVYDDPDDRFGTFSVVDETGAPTARAPATQEGSGHSSLIPLAPIRLLETRSGLSTVDNGFNGIGIRPADSVLELGIVGRADMPEWARSVVLNVTVTGALGSGFLTVYPCGETRPLSSNLNYDSGTTRAVAVVARIGALGAVCVYTQSPTHVVVDLTGFYSFGASFTGVQPARLLETRIGPEFTTVDAQTVGVGRRPGGSITEVKVAGRGTVPADAKAVAVNVTMINPSLAGFASVFPCGEAVPLASTVNFTAGSIVPNAAMVKIGAGGSICVFSNVETDLILDVNGYDAAPAVVRFLDPTRVLETRVGLRTADHQFEGIGIRPEDSVLELPIGGRVAVPKAIRAVVLNVTVTEAIGAGFVTVYPCSATRPIASTLNYGVGTTVANLTVATTTSDGRVCIYTQRPTHVVVDLSGYHT